MMNDTFEGNRDRIMEMAFLVREAVSEDAQQAAELLDQLGHPDDPASVAAGLRHLAATGSDRVFVAERDGVLLGLRTLHWLPLLHRPMPLGRITALVVREEARGQGIGRTLVKRGLQELKAAGCGLVEVTSNVRREEAHAFYRALGFGSPSLYFRIEI